MKRTRVKYSKILRLYPHVTQPDTGSSSRYSLFTPIQALHSNQLLHPNQPLHPDTGSSLLSASLSQYSIDHISGIERTFTLPPLKHLQHQDRHIILNMSPAAPQRKLQDPLGHLGGGAFLHIAYVLTQHIFIITGAEGIQS